MIALTNETITAIIPIIKASTNNHGANFAITHDIQRKTASKHTTPAQ